MTTTVDPGRGIAARTPARRRMFALPEMRWAGASTACFGLAALGGPAGIPEWLALALYAACYLTGGWGPALEGLRALRDKTLDVDLLMVVAAFGAAAIGQVLDGALLIVIFATSGALEALATARTEDSVRGLLDLAPERAALLTADGERTVPAAGLAIGDEILIRPGERVGADGTVLDGRSEVDQATITGEPLPVAKERGDPVFAGTLNGTGALRVEVRRESSDTVVARIAKLVDEAAGSKARTQLFIERIEQRYSVGVVLATLALFFVPLALGDPLRETLLRAMTFMIVASPCAVVLATMPPLLAAIANAGRHGVLVKSATVLERLATGSRFAFDKTGTLTTGTPRVRTVAPVGGLDERELLGLAAAAERRSEHPIATAIMSAARERGLDPAEPTGFQAMPGSGVRATVDGREVLLGSPARLGAATGESARLAEAGLTAVVVRVDGRTAGVLGIGDTVRPEAVGAVADLRMLTGAAPVLVTGDNEPTARHLAAELGITEVYADLLPEDKVALIRRMQDEGAGVVAVGDGVNDAPALAAAHVGIAMGRAGADLTVQAADVIVVRDELSAIPSVLALARRARRVVLANLTIAGTFITALVVWDLLGELPLPLGVAGHEGSTILVGLNGLRLLRRAAWRR